MNSFDVPAENSIGAATAIFTPTSDTTVTLKVELAASAFDTEANNYSALIEVIADGTFVAELGGATDSATGTDGFVAGAAIGQQGSFLLGSSEWTASTSLTFDADSGYLGIGSSTPSALLTISSTTMASTTALISVTGESGTFKIFAASGTPENAIGGTVGSLAVDVINGQLYIKNGTTTADWTEAGGGVFEQHATRTLVHVKESASTSVVVVSSTVATSTDYAKFEVGGDAFIDGGLTLGSQTSSTVGATSSTLYNNAGILTWESGALQLGTGTIMLQNNGHSYFGEDNTLSVGTSTQQSNATLTVDSMAASTTAVMALINQAVQEAVTFYVTGQDPNNFQAAATGSLAIDGELGRVFVKTSGSATSTGWTQLSTADPTVANVTATTTQVLDANVVYHVDSSAGTTTLTLPSSPNNGAKVTIIDIAGHFAGTSTALVAGAGDTIEGTTTSTLDTSNSVNIFYYDSAQNRWTLDSEIGESTQLHRVFISRSYNTTGDQGVNTSDLTYSGSDVLDLDLGTARERDHEQEPTVLPPPPGSRDRLWWQRRHRSRAGP